MKWVDSSEDLFARVLSSQLTHSNFTKWSEWVSRLSHRLESSYSLEFTFSSEWSEVSERQVDSSRLTSLVSLFQVKSNRVSRLKVDSLHSTQVNSLLFFKKLPFLVLNNFYSVLMLFFALITFKLLKSSYCRGNHFRFMKKKPLNSTKLSVWH